MLFCHYIIGKSATLNGGHKLVDDLAAFKTLNRLFERPRENEFKGKLVVAGGKSVRLCCRRGCVVVGTVSSFKIGPFVLIQDAFKSNWLDSVGAGRENWVDPFEPYGTVKAERNPLNGERFSA